MWTHMTREGRDEKILRAINKKIDACERKERCTRRFMSCHTKYMETSKRHIKAVLKKLTGCV